MSEVKYHVNGKGEVRRCWAKLRPCPLKNAQGEPVPHYATPEEAQTAYENAMEATMGLMPPPVKQEEGKSTTPQEEARRLMKELGPAWTLHGPAVALFDRNPELITEFAPTMDADAKGLLASKLTNARAGKALARSLAIPGSDREGRIALALLKNPKVGKVVHAQVVKTSPQAAAYERLKPLVEGGTLQALRSVDPRKPHEVSYKFKSEDVRKYSLGKDEVEVVVKHIMHEALFMPSFDASTSTYRGYTN